MTQAEIQLSISELIALVESGKILEAFDTFYHKDLIAQENLSDPRIGKATNREFEKSFVNDIISKRVYKATSHIVGSNVSAIAWEIDIDHKSWVQFK